MNKISTISLSGKTSEDPFITSLSKTDQDIINQFSNFKTTSEKMLFALGGKQVVDSLPIAGNVSFDLFNHAVICCDMIPSSIAQGRRNSESYFIIKAEDKTTKRIAFQAFITRDDEYWHHAGCPIIDTMFFPYFLLSPASSSKQKENENLFLLNLKKFVESKENERFKLVEKSL